MRDQSTIWLFCFLLLQFLAYANSLLDANSIRADMATLNVVCRGLDSCRDNRTSDSLKEYNCHCDIYCRDLGTCCVDSRFRPLWRYEPRYIAKCLPVYGKEGFTMFMVDECRRGWRDENAEFVKDMCSSNGEDRNDPFLAVPVTSLRTGITYKNYYCSVCNENPPDGQVAFWNVGIESTTKSITNPTDRDIVYDPDHSSWAIQSDDGSWASVKLDLRVPDSVQQAIRPCRSTNIDQVSQCSPNWQDKSVAEKCSAYTALVHAITNTGMVRYKNPHCAICNFEEAYSVNCEERLVTAVGFAATKQTFFVGLFVLEDEPKRRRCEQGKVYDGLAKKCRTVRCKKNHTIRGNKCIPNN